MRILSILPIALLAGSCAAPPKPQPPYKPLATLEEVMHGMVIPNAQIVWKSVGTIITKDGVEEIRPKTEDDWIDIEASATILMEAGNLLMMLNRTRGGVLAGLFFPRRLTLPGAVTTPP